jgi:hypothetical protein
MSLDRGRRDLDGIAGDLAREDQQRLTNEQARLTPRPATRDDGDGPRDRRPSLASVIWGRIKRALGLTT